MKLKFKHIISIFLLMIFINVAFGQTDNKKDKIDALRISFITKKVTFTAQESQAFWPL